jgi:crotonobetaine/carnitine-CoA ligase
MDDLTIIGSLNRAVEMNAEKELIKFTTGGSHRADFTWEQAAKFGGLLIELGVRPGDRVLIMVSNRFEFITAVFGSAYLGAIFVPINTNMRGPILEHMFRDADARVLVVEEQFSRQASDALSNIGATPTVLMVGEWPEPPRESVDFTQALAAAEPASPRDVSRYDNACIMYTSGTTGPSKGVLHTQASIVEFGGKAQWLFEYTAEDVSHNCLPLFHANALCVTLLASVRAGATSVFGQRFSASGFWPEVRRYQATVTSILGAMVPILWSADPAPTDTENSVRVALSVPTPPADIYHAFEKRFGIRLVSQYGMTDTAMVIGTPSNIVARPGYAGVASPDFECVVADDNDNPLPDGTAGELIVRPLRPDVMMRCYWNNPAATVEAYRNLWFHTGDILVREPDGWFMFLDRKKDAIRRFGENISSWEVETVIAMHPAVAEVAVYAVPAELSEDEVMAAVVFKPEHGADLNDIAAHCDAQLPYFASPRYLVELETLPKTENEKVRKDVLRATGVTSTTLDRGGRGRKTERPPKA